MICPRPSIQRYLVVYLSGAVIVLFGLSSIWVYLYMRHAFYKQVDANLMRVAEDFIAETERTPDGGVECEFHDMDLENFKAGESDRKAYYELRDYRGEVLIRSASLAEGERLPFRRVEAGAFQIEHINIEGKHPGRVVFASFPLALEKQNLNDPGDLAEVVSRTPAENAFIEAYDEGAPMNRAFLAITENTAGLRQTLLVLGSVLSLTGAFLAGIILLLVRKIVLIACRPIVEISQITEQMGADNLASQLPVENVPSELLPLIIRFNQFIERLDTAIRRERRFSIDIAHELRTPIAEIRALMEIAADTPGNETGEDSLEIYQQGAAISQRMSTIMETLTAIYKGSSEKFQPNSKRVSLQLILQQAIDSFDPIIQGRFRFESKAASCAEITTDPELLRAIVDNLLQNAAVHSPDLSDITVACCANGFSIENATSDLGEGDLELMKEPFWQRDSARENADRFGLGLTLVDAYLRLLNGCIDHHLDRGILTAKVTLTDLPEIS
jgi:two-component system sensor histidine kinase QseC